MLDALRLADDAYRVVGADASPVKLHLSAATERLVVPRADAPGYLDAIRTAVERWDIDVVHAQPDPDVLAIGGGRDTIPARICLPSQEVLERAADKVATAEALTRHHVAVPCSRPVESFDDLRAATTATVAAHGGAWVRARRGAGSRASLPVRHADQAEAWARWWVDERGLAVGDFMVSELLPGREFAFQSIWQHGRLVVAQSRERVEYLYGHLTPSGQTSTPAVARTVDEPEVDAIAADAVRAIDPAPHGVYCVDVKQDRDGRPKVTEINAGRFFTTSNFFAHAGLNMPAMLVRMACGEELPILGSSPLPADLYWIRMVDMGFRLVPGDELASWPRAAA